LKNVFEMKIKKYLFLKKIKIFLDTV